MGRKAMKKKAAAAASRAERAKTVPAPNPFELKTNRRKHKVIDNRRQKHNTFNQVNSRARAEELRSQTLLVEREQDRKANTFLDRRFGENDTNMADEDKMLMRYQAEKQRRLRKGRSDFSVEDTEELTHFGEALGGDAGFDRLSDDEGGTDSEGERIETEFTAEYNFGGFNRKEGQGAHEALDDGDGAEPERPRSKKEIMEEVIRKSKKYRAERARDKEEKDDLIDELDESFKEIRGLLELASEAPRGGGDSQASAAAPEEKSEVEREHDAAAREYNKTKYLLAGDLRAQAGDRLKSEKELAVCHLIARLFLSHPAPPRAVFGG
eukprot:SAG25_NODE_192_length_12211_cov_44.011394_7_plen_324_part_00